MYPTLKRALLWTGVALGSLLLVLFLAVALMDWNLLKHPLERIASSESGRAVTIAGDLQAHVWSLTPTVTVNGLTVGNPPWEVKRPMLQVQRLEVRLKLLPLLAGDVILPRVLLIKPDVYLHQDRSGRANWTFENKAPTNAPTSSPTELPVIRDLVIESGKLMLADDIRRLKIDGTIEANAKASKNDPQPFRIEGKGTINEQPFEMRVAGGPLVNLDPRHPYPFDLNIMAGDLRVASDGRVLKPFSLSDLDFEVTLSGSDLAEGFYLTQLALPNTPPFNLHVHIERHGNRVGVTHIAGKVGESDLQGHLDIDATRKRPWISGDLTSRQLRMQDLAVSLGHKSKAGEAPLARKTSAQPTTAARAEPKSNAAPADPNAHLFPDARLQVTRVRVMDADVHFRAQSVDAGTLPLKQVAFRIRLDNGVLSLNPLAADMPEGRLSGQVTINARTDVPRTHIDLRMKDIQLAQLKGKSQSTPPLRGVMQARAVIDGTGDSLHRVMSNANGMFTVILPNGEVRSAFAELTGINVTKGLGLLLTKAQDREPIRCGVAQFAIKDGLMSASNVTVDTQDVLIRGQGDIRLGPEELNLQIKGDPKKPRLTRVRAPIEVRGHLMKPSVGLDVGSTVKQGAVAAALGAIATPFAAILAFVDPGLAKDQNCAAMLAETAHKGPPPPRSAAVAPPQGTKLR